jgi:TPR repeat protein/serine/threonine protein kinase
MWIFFQCVAEAVAEKGLRGLAEMVPGGGLMFDIAKGTWEKYRSRCKMDKMQEDVQRMVQATPEEVKQVAAKIAKQVAAEEIREQVEIFLTQIPVAAQKSLKRADDPTGTSLPANFSLRSAEDVAKLLPATLPRFKPGDALPGRPGWALERFLGGGGFGEVWLAHQTQFRLFRAVKFCKSLENRDLVHEGAVIARLISQGNHPNIVPLLDAHLDCDVPWLMYEYVEGGDLADRIRQWTKLPATERQHKAVTALEVLAKAVGRFHRLKPAIIHRDLKPANILYDRNTGQLRITDFGIGGVEARNLIENEKRGFATKVGRLQTCLRGSHTPLYTSLQQREGKEPDARDDVHALGVIGYQMLTCQLDRGVGPDFAEDLKEASVEDWLIELLRRCTASKAERRLKDAGEIAELLSKTAGVSTRSLDSSSPEPLKKELANHGIEIDFPGMAAKGDSRAEVRQPTARTPCKLHYEADSYADVRQDEPAYLHAAGIGKAEQFLSKRAPERIGRWKEAAQRGFAPAQHLYASCLAFAYGIGQNHAEAVSWFRKAAAQGFPPAQSSLGGMYLDGRGVQKDDVQAVTWRRKAAERGFAPAQVSLGAMYLEGRGVPKDDDQAVAWIRKAAEQGNAMSQFLLGALYAEGRGVPKDEVQAVTLLRKAAGKGVPESQYVLGLMYADGRGVPKDEEQAAIWYRKAADQGHEDAKKALRRLEK